MQGDVFLPPEAPSTGAMPAYFRKGLIVSFNPANGENVVRVSGQDWPNLPILVSGSETAFQVGMTVGIIVVGTAAFIVGRIAVPGSSAYASTASAFGSGSNAVAGFPVTNVFATIASCSIPVPAWAGHALMVASVRGFAKNSTGSQAPISSSVRIPGHIVAGDFGAGQDTQAGSIGIISCANTAITAVTPGGTMVAEAMVTNLGVGANWAADAGWNKAVLVATAIFTT